MKILIAGDFCPSERIVDLIENGKYADLFYEIKPIVTSADYSIVNLECPIIDSVDVKPIIKCGPNLRCSSKVIGALKYAGFKCTTLANNHFRDFGDEGCISTVKFLNESGIDHVGDGANLVESQKVLYKTIEKDVIGIINVCEHESSIATAIHAGSAPFEYVDVYNKIIEARSKADYVLVVVHGGNEHYQLPSPRMKKAYRWFVDLGVDAVVNHHQHCYNGYEVYKGKPIFYGIGNFCFDNKARRNTIWDEGFMVELSFESNKIGYSLIPYKQCKEFPSVSLMNDLEKYAFNEVISSLNLIIQNDELLECKYNDFCNEMSVEWLFNLEPYKRNRLFPALFRRGYLPSFFTKGKAKWLINFIECESQVTRLLSALKSKLQ